ncbi:MAG: ABC transporter ATP-binding protein [Planctomycetota bacterium]
MCELDVILRARDVHHAYRTGRVETPVLHGIDLDIRRGEFVVVMGPSGCGKSTLLNILGLMMRPTAGAVDIDGTPTRTLGDAGRTLLRRRKLGFVFQRFNLLPVLTAEQNVEIALKLRGEGVNGRPLSVLDRIGLKAKRRSKPDEMSVGEQQRVAIARAVVARPMLLLADEPTGNLDSHSAGEVLDLLAELNASDGLTTVMITHNERLTDRADRVLQMRDGRI